MLCIPDKDHPIYIEFMLYMDKEMADLASKICNSRQGSGGASRGLAKRATPACGRKRVRKNLSEALLTHRPPSLNEHNPTRRELHGSATYTILPEEHIFQWSGGGGS